MRRNLFRIISIIAYSNAILLIVSMLGFYISPEIILFPAVLNLFSPFILWLNLLILILFLFRKKFKQVIVIAISIVIYFPAANNLIFFPRKTTAQPGTEIYSIASFNVRQFDHYNWIKEYGTSQQIYHYIRELNTDILCLQEFLQSPHKKFNSIDSLIGYPWQYYSYTPYSKSDKKYNSGLVIFSLYPIINSQTIWFPETVNKALYADILMNKDTIRVFNVHLESVHFNQEDYNFINRGVAQMFRLPVTIKNIYTKLAFAYKKRARQIQILKNYVEKSPYPVILCGDLNDTPSSFAYFQLQQILKDSFVESGFGFGKTYIGHFPWLRIDYIFHSPHSIQSLKFSISDIRLSDHYPIKLNFFLAR